MTDVCHTYPVDRHRVTYSRRTEIYAERDLAFAKRIALDQGCPEIDLDVVSYVTYYASFLKYSHLEPMMARKSKKPKEKGIAKEDVGAAMMAWYADALKQNPEGLITQAQAAVILGISRMAMSRLVARGYVRAEYFPKPPDVQGVSVGGDDPTWLKILGWLGMRLDLADTYNFPQACYVSFGDIMKIWETGEARKKCQRDWNEIVATFLPKEKRLRRNNELNEGHCKEAE